MDNNALVNISAGITEKAWHTLSIYVVKPIIRTVKSHPYVIGGIGMAVGSFAIADDIHQRRKSRTLIENQNKTTEALRKHEARIQSLEKEAERVKTLEKVNKQLNNALTERIS